MAPLPVALSVGVISRYLGMFSLDHTAPKTLISSSGNVLIKAIRSF